MKLCDTCIYRNNVEQLKPCVVYRDDCKLYERGDMSNEDAANVIKSGLDNNSIDCFDIKQYMAIDMALKALEQEPKTGHWIGHREHCENLGVIPSGLGAYKWCSNCDCGIDVREWHRNNYKYCPNCGADMRGDTE